MGSSSPKGLVTLQNQKQSAGVFCIVAALGKVEFMVVGNPPLSATTLGHTLFTLTAFHLGGNNILCAHKFSIIEYF